MTSPLLQPIKTDLPRDLASLRTTHALLFHTANHGNALARVTAHPVQETAGGPQIGPGNLLTPEDEVRIAHLLAGVRTQPSGPLLLPANLLASTARMTAWFLPGVERAMHFCGDQRAFSVTVHWPNLVLAATRGSLYVVAVRVAQRPGYAEEPLFQAPLANVWEGIGRVCTGSAVPPAGWDVASIDAWTAVLTDTAFTHANTVPMRGMQRNGTEQIQAFWRKREGQGLFPADKLMPLGMTLGAWLEAVSQEGNGDD